MNKIVRIVSVLLFMNQVANGRITFKSIEEVWSYALQNNPANQINSLLVEKAHHDQKSVGSTIYPSIQGTISGQHNINIAATPIPGEILGQPGEVEYVQFGLPYVYNAGITLNKTLLDWQSLYNSKIAKINTQLKETEKLYYEQNLKEQVAQIYYATLTAKLVVQIADKDLQISESIVSLTTMRYEEGLTDVLTLNQAKINRNNAFEWREQNQLYYITNISNLKMILGLSVSDSLMIEEAIEITELEAYNSIASNNLELKLFEQKLAIAELERKKASSNFSPRLNFMSSLGRIQYQEYFSFSLNSSDWQENSYIGLNLSVPIFSGLVNKHQLNSSKTALTIENLTYADEKRKSTIEDSLLMNNYQSSVKLAQSAKSNLQLAAENKQLALTKYSEGLISLDNYLSVSNEYLDIEKQFINRLSEFLLNKASVLSRNN